MANIESRVRAKDGQVSHRVRWREGGKAEAFQPTVTLYDEQQAKDLKYLVDRAGQHWPADEELRAFGLDFLCRDQEEPEEVLIGEIVLPLTSAEYFEMYVEAVIDSGSVKGYEKKAYRQKLRDHVVPYIGHIPIAELSKADLRKWQNALATRGGLDKDGNPKGLGSKTILNIRGSIVAPALACANDADNNFDLPKVREDNPLTKVKAPRKRRTYKPIIEDEYEAALLIEGMYMTGNRSLGDLVSNVLCSSLRLQEGVALTVGACNQRRRYNTIFKVAKRAENGSWVIVDEPKTEAGYRTPPYPDEFAPMFAERCTGRPPGAFIFPGPMGGHWQHSTLGKYFRRGVKFAQQLGLNKWVTFRELRHSGATRWKSEGLDLETIRQLMGHESITTTSDHYFGQLSTAELDRARATMSPIASAALSLRSKHQVVIPGQRVSSRMESVVLPG